MSTKAHALLTATLSVTTLATLAAGCVGDVGGGDAARSRKPKTGDEQTTDDGTCKQVNTPVTLRAAADFDKLPTTCWDLYSKLRIEGSAITSIAKLGKLKSVNDLEIVDTGLASIDTAQAFDVWGAITVSGNSKLTSLDKLHIQDADDLTTAYVIRNNAVLTSLAGVGYAKTVEGELRIADNARLGAIDFGELTTAGSIAIINNAATTLDLGSLQTVGRIEVSNNGQLTNVTGPAAATIKGDLVIRGNRALTQLGSWGGLTRLEGNLTIDDNDALANLGGLAGMQYVTSSVTITNNALIDNIDAVSHLRGIGTTVLVTGNSNLSNCKALEIDHCVQSGAVTFNSNKANTGNNCPRCWCE